MPMAPAPELREVARVYVPGPYRLAAAQPQKKPTIKPLVAAHWEPLVADRQGNVALKAAVGRGTIIAVSEAEVFGNSDLGRADNLVLAANVLFGAGAERLYFDERLHLHGAAQGADVRALPLGRLKQALWLALAAVAVFLVGVGVRFGAATPLVEKPRRSAMEYVEALADLYRRAEARKAVWGLLRQSFRRRLSAAAGTPPNLPPERLAATLALRRHADAAQVQAVLQQLEAMPEHPSDDELLHLAQQVAAIEEAVTHEH